MTTWTHKVVKIARNTQGQWFDFPTAATFANEADAMRYAADFAREQGEAGLGGIKITVRTRKGNKCIASIDIAKFRSAAVS